jgi:GTP cyclohydrolase IA
MPQTVDAAEYYFEKFMAACGLDVNDPQLKDTPARYAKLIKGATKNYRKPPVYTTDAHYDSSTQIKATLFPAPGISELVTEKGMSFSSICAHHFSPFMGQCHIGYIPNGAILGLSKFARVLDFFCLRPQTQEVLTEEICAEIHSLTKAEFVAVVMEAEHTCMSCRGPRKLGAKTVTSKFIGSHAFTDTRKEFLQFIQR